MIRRVIVFGSILLGIVSGCKNAQENFLPKFTVTIPDINLKVPAISFVAEDEIPIGALRAPINLDSTIRANTAGAFGSAAVHSIKVKRIILKLKDASEKNNFSNFERATIRIYSDTSSVDIATISFPQFPTDSLIITPNASPDISKYLKAATISYNLYWKNRRPISKPLKLQIRIALVVQ